MKKVLTVCRIILNTAMPVRSSSLALLVAFVATAGMQVWGLDPNLPPSDNFDLSTWKVTLPDQSEEDVADIVGFESANEFYTDPVTGAMVFRCPNDGATGGSSYPRSELREMLRGTDTSISTKGINSNNWVFSTATLAHQQDSGGVDGTMTATLTVDHVSTTASSDSMVGRVIVGQIHASGDEPCRLYYRKLPGNTKGSIYIAHEPTDATGRPEEWYEMIGSRSSSASDPADGVALGEQFSYEIDVVGNDLNVTIMRPGKPDVTQYVDMSLSGHGDDWMYFKAGCYNQANGGDAGEYAQVSFFALTKSHTLLGQSALTVASPYGSPTPAVGTSSYMTPSVINASMSGSPEVSGSSRQVVTGWTGTGDVVPGSGSSTSFTITQNSSITWQWETQYLLDTGVSGNGAVDVDENTWLDTGSNITVTAIPNPGYEFLTWSGDISSTNPVINVTMDAAKSITATFTGPVSLDVASPYGTPTPAVGSASYTYGTLINAAMSGSPEVSGTTRQVVAGWTGTGDVVAGSGASTDFTLTQNSTITWQWQTQYWLDTEVSGNGSVDVVDAWFDSGNGVTITATPDAGNYFVNWSGASSSTDPVLNLTMDAAKSVTANFAVGTNPTPVKLVVSSVSASSDDGNTPDNTLDGNLLTRWSANGDGEYITYDLGTLREVRYLEVAYYNGNDRVSTNDVQVSVDGTTWTDVLINNVSSGSTEELENVDIPDTNARYVRIVGHGNSANDWNSLTEVEIWGVAVYLPVDVNLPPPEPVGGGLQFTLPTSISGVLYQLEYTDTLSANSVTPVSWELMDGPLTGDGGDLILTDPGPLTSNRFYRLFIQYN